jgi:hypothetical protein
MPKGRTDAAKIGPGEYEHHGGSVGAVRTRFLLQIRHDLPDVLETLRALDGSEPALLTWAAHWHLQDRWTLDVARRTFEEWQRWPALAMHLRWADVIQTGELVPEPPAIRWEPTLQSEQEFRAMVEEYITDVRGWASALGLTKPPQKPMLTRDLEALVQYHVKGDDLDAVADDHFGGADKEDAARKALTSLAKLINLTLRRK